MTDLRRLGRTLRVRRLAAGLSAASVAKSAGITPAYLSILETGRNPKTRRPSRPSEAILGALARALGTDPAELLQLAGHTGPSQSREPGHSPAASAHAALASLRRGLRELQADLDSIAETLPGEPEPPVASGLPGVEFRQADHVLLLSADVAADFDLTLRIAAAGLDASETAILRLPPGRPAAEALDRLRRLAPSATGQNVLLTPWEDGVLKRYAGRRFTRKETLQAHGEDLARATAGRPSLIRFLTPDASAYLRWVENPGEVLDYEHAWPADLARLSRGVPLLMLCLYRLEDLEARATRQRSLAGSVLSLLSSHTRILYIGPDDRLLADAGAVRATLAGLDMAGEPPSAWTKLHGVGHSHGIWGEPS